MSDKFNIVIIKQNDLNVTVETLDQIKPYTIFESVCHDEMMELVVKTIELDKDQMGSTTLCYDDDKLIYQLCHFNKEDNGSKNDEKDKNCLASALTLGQLSVYGDCVLICSRIVDDFTCGSETITPDTLSELYLKKMVHIGIKVYPDGKLEEIKFVEDPFDMVDNRNNYQIVETPFYKFSLLQLIQYVAEPDILNRDATKVSGRFKVHGISYFVSKVTETDYEDLTIDLFKNMVKLAEGDLRDRELKDDEKDDQKKDNIPIIMNRHCIIKKRLNELNRICLGCKENLDYDSSISKLCLGCYRVKYHNEECQKKDWLSHKNLCLHNKSEITKILKK